MVYRTLLFGLALVAHAHPTATERELRLMEVVSR